MFHDGVDILIRTNRGREQSEQSGSYKDLSVAHRGYPPFVIPILETGFVSSIRGTVPNDGLLFPIL